MLKKIKISFNDCVDIYELNKNDLQSLADKKNIKLDKQEIDKLTDGSASVILKLKKYYNRPRPKDQAKQYGIDIDTLELASMKTPSYPSGHSAQGVLIGMFFKDFISDKVLNEPSAGGGIFLN